MSILRKYFLPLVVSTIISFEALGQAAPSPFTTFGIGEHYGSALTNNQGMGGVGIGLPRVWFINNQNPALLPYTHNRLTFFQAGIALESKNISSAETAQRGTGGNLNFIALAFPIRPKDPLKPHRWTTSIGLTPYTNVNYQLEYTDAIENSTNTIAVTEEGSGGLSQVYWANGYRISRNVSVGLRASYIFGSVENSYSNELNETAQPVPYRIEVSERTYMKDFNFLAGVSYVKDSIFNNRLILSAGAVYSLGSDMSASKTFKFSRTDIIGNIVDSLTLATQKGTIHLPEELGFGIGLSKGFKWAVGADFVYRDWSEFTSLDSEDEENLSSSWQASLGLEFTPDPEAVANFLKRVSYRAGMSMGKLPYLANNNEVKDFGINFGFSVPAGRSSLDLAFRLGKRGNKSENILEESYFRVYFGLTLNDTWFIKRKFD